MFLILAQWWCEYQTQELRTSKLASWQNIIPLGGILLILTVHWACHSEVKPKNLNAMIKTLRQLRMTSRVNDYF